MMWNAVKRVGIKWLRGIFIQNNSCVSVLSNRLGYHQTPIPDPYRIRNWKRFAQNSLEKGENAKASTVWGERKIIPTKKNAKEDETQKSMHEDWKNGKGRKSTSINFFLSGQNWLCFIEERGWADITHHKEFENNLVVSRARRWMCLSHRTDGFF